MNGPTILLADDDKALRDSLSAVLKSEGFSVLVAHDGLEAVEKSRTNAIDLMLLDVMMPKMNGFCACEEIRQTNANVPVIFLTALDGEADQVRALGLGADDYVLKTTSDAVLIARIRRALERRRQADMESALIHLSRVTIDRNLLTVTEGGRALGTLTRTELAVLTTLLKNAGRTMTVEELVSAVRGDGFACAPNLISSYISKLKKKLGTAASLILCVRGVGYLLVK